jgi:hypothetical protein
LKLQLEIPTEHASMSCRSVFFVFLLASCVGWLNPSSAMDRQSCPVTTPDHAFVPPSPYDSIKEAYAFLYGRAKLWTVIYTHYTVLDAVKLPFFRLGYDYPKETFPQLTVVARRLDQDSPLVWSGRPTGGHIPGKGPEGMFMLTGVDLPSPGCWEIAAHYVAPDYVVQALSYTVWVEP